MNKLKSAAIVVLCFGMAMLFSACSVTKNITDEKRSSLYPGDSISILYHTEWTKNHYRERIQEFKKTPLQKGDIVFLGNSITEGGKDWGAKLNLPNVKNRGIAGDCTDGVLQRLGEINFFKPKAVYILIGVNDLFNLHYQQQIPSPEYVANNIFKIAQAIHHKTPRTKIYVQTILPTTQDFMKDNINKVNHIIKAHGNDKFFTVIDLNSIFADATGFLRKELTYDGTHLNDDGYAVWVEALKPYLAIK